MLSNVPTMIHPLTVQKLRNVLLNSRQWRIVSSLFEPELSPLDDPYLSAWLPKHTHSHKAIEVMIALEGNGTYGLCGRMYPAPPGAVFILGPDEAHSLGYPARNLCRFTHLWIGAFSDFHEVTYSVRSGRRYEDTSKIDGLMVTVADSLVSLNCCLGGLYASRRQNPELVRTKVVGALALVASAIAERADSPTPAATHLFQKDVVEMIQEHIDRTGGKDASLDNLARVSGYSKYHLSRIFRRHTGRSIHEYVDLCRATRLVQLRNAGLKKTQIAQELGFSCLRALDAWERKWYGRFDTIQHSIASDLP